jgi:hypothetical protein
MLRLTVVVLLALNLLLIGVQVASEPSPSPPPPVIAVEPFPADAPRLVLLRETTPDATPAATPAATREVALNASPTSSRNATPGAPNAAPDATPDSTPDSTPNETPDIPADETLGATPIAGAGDLPLLCYTAGPFETVPTLIEAREALGPLALGVKERDTEALVELGFWVSLPPLESFREAGALVQALNQAGQQDVAIVTDDSGEYRVSLGYFLEENNARRRRDEVRALGFDADTQVQRETQPRFWLDYAFRDVASAELAAAALPAGEQREIPCPETPGP